MMKKKLGPKKEHLFVIDEQFNQEKNKNSHICERRHITKSIIISDNR